MKLIKLLLCLTIISTLVGCTKNTFEEKQAEPLVIIAGKHANAKMFTTNMLEQAKEMILDSFSYSYDKNTRKYKAKAHVDIIISDSSPSVVVLENELECAMNNEEALYGKVDELTNELLDLLVSDKLKADHEEVDIITSMNEAKLVLNQYDDNLEKNILIMDTGITTKTLDMTQLDLIKDDIDDIINTISPDRYPNLQGINVTFVGLGNVDGIIQKNYSYNIKFQEKLILLWERLIVDKCYATLKQDIKFLNSEGNQTMDYLEDGTGYPFVSNVIFSENQAIDNVELLYLGFKADSDEFINEKASISQIEAYSKLIKQHLKNDENCKIYVVGSIAKTSEQEFENHPLSNKRSQKIVNILVNVFGVNKDNLVAIDGGTTNFSWRNYKDFDNGLVNPKNQELNRVVAMVVQGSDEEDELKEKGYIK